MLNLPKVTLSASRIKTFYSCSYLYWAKYIAKLPDPSNAGAAVGSAVHDLSEILFTKEQKYKTVIENCLKVNKLTDGMRRFFSKHLKKSGFLSIENVEKAERFTLVALANDFWMQGAVIRKLPEAEFLIGDAFKLKGFIDKYGLYKDNEGDWYTIIFDYKSQKEKFTDKEMEFNVQALAYLLAAKTLHPEINILKSSVKFILLAYPEDPIQEFKLKDKYQLEGLKVYLENTQQEIDSFGFGKRLSNPASKQNYPKPEDGFKGPLMCGRAKEPGQLKKDGTKMWHCTYKFGFDYWAAIDKDGKTLFSSFTEFKPTDKYTVVKKRYNGCEACYQRR